MNLPDPLWKAVEGQPGWCWRAKADRIYQLALDPSVKVGVEIGVYGGRSLIPLCAALIPRGDQVFGYDVYRPHEVVPAGREYWNNLNYDALYQTTKAKLFDLGYGPCIVHRLSSDQAARQFADESVQYVHIDGSHREWDSAEDIILWSRRLTHGGHMVIDDTNWDSLKFALELLKYGRLELIETLSHPIPGERGGEAQIWRKA